MVVLVTQQLYKQLHSRLVQLARITYHLFSTVQCDPSHRKHQGFNPNSTPRCELKGLCEFMRNLEKGNGGTSMHALKQPIEQYYLVSIGKVLCYQFEVKKMFLLKAKVKKNDKKFGPPISIAWLYIPKSREKGSVSNIRPPPIIASISCKGLKFTPKIAHPIDLVRKVFKCNMMQG